MRKAITAVWTILTAVVVVGSLYAILVYATRVHASPINDHVYGGTSSGTYDLMGECLKLDESEDPDSYICPTGANEITMTLGGADTVVCDASACAPTVAWYLNDEVPLSWGGTVSVPDIELLWTDEQLPPEPPGPYQLRLMSEDCDEVGTDCRLMYIETGSNDIVVDEDLVIEGVTLISKGTTTAPGLGFIDQENVGFHWPGTSTLDLIIAEKVFMRLQEPSVNYGPNQIGFAAGDPSVAAVDTGLCRARATVVKATSGCISPQGCAGFFKMGKVHSSTVLSEPFPCDIDSHGTIVTHWLYGSGDPVGVIEMPCICLHAGSGGGFDWRSWDDPVNNECPYY